MPGFLEGLSSPLYRTATYHALSTSSILGVPLGVFGSLVVGYIIFGMVLQATGGGEFFFSLASVLLGHTRGGPAKVAVVASGFFGMMSGSAISNVLTIGPITIPLMKKIGFSAEYAGGIETVSSTGGVLMPPVMGAVAFVMAGFLGVPYQSSDSSGNLLLYWDINTSRWLRC
jgi:TRAP-type uncharacterized transport system fused permease subunit